MKGPTCTAPAQARVPAAAAAAAARGPNYKAPDWAGKPGPPLSEAPLTLDLVVRGEVKESIELDTQSYHSFCIGRAKTCDVVLDGFEPQASRFHCIIQCKEGSSDLFVYDLKSAHGTMLNGQIIEPHTFIPLHIGEQLRFCADKPASCFAVLNGAEALHPEDEEEGEVDLSALQAKAAGDRAAFLQAQQAELQRRKDAKKVRMAKESRQKALVNALQAKAKEQQKAQAQLLAQDRAKMQEVSWGMGEDAVDVPINNYTDDAQKLLDADGKLDFEKVRSLKLTTKQETMVTKAEAKHKKLENVMKEKRKIEEQMAQRAQKKAQQEFEIDVPDEPFRGGGNADKLSSLEAKVEKLEEELSDFTDNIFLSLGFKIEGDKTMRISKKRVAMYDTHDIDDEDDDFFDRTVVKKGNNATGSGPGSTDDAGLPDFNTGVETKATLESKIKVLKIEQQQVGSQIAHETLKAETAKARGVGNEDSLESFMGATLESLSVDRLAKLKRRRLIIETKLKEGMAMLEFAKTNNEAASAPGKASKAAMPSTPALAVAAVAQAGAVAQAAAASAIAAAAAGKKPTTESGSGADVGAVGKAKKSIAASGSSSGGIADALKSATFRAAINEHEDRIKQERLKGESEPSVSAAAAAADAAATGTATADTASTGADGQKEAQQASASHTSTLATSSSSAASAPAPKVAVPYPHKQVIPEGMRARVDVNRGGLQVQPKLGQGTSEASSDPTSEAPPPEKKRKVYGAMRPPPNFQQEKAANDGE